jgi:hypothetical protein
VTTSRLSTPKAHGELSQELKDSTAQAADTHTPTMDLPTSDSGSTTNGEGSNLSHSGSAPSMESTWERQQLMDSEQATDSSANCLHNYREIASTQRDLLETIVFAKIETHQTLILHRCERCGDKFVQVLDGHWTLEEVRGHGD